MYECNYCANRKCKRLSTNLYPKMKTRPGNKWDMLDKHCDHYIPIKSTQKLGKFARVNRKGGEIR